MTKFLWALLLLAVCGSNALAQPFLQRFENVHVMLFNGREPTLHGAVMTEGKFQRHDGLGAIYLWDELSTAATNADYSVLSVPGIPVGRYFQMYAGAFSGTVPGDTIYVTNIFDTFITSTTTITTNLFSTYIISSNSVSANIQGQTNVVALFTPDNFSLGPSIVTQNGTNSITVNGNGNGLITGGIDLTLGELGKFTKFPGLIWTENPQNGPLNAYAYGAAGDGVTDDTVALQSWIQAAQTNALPLSLKLPKGKFRITAPLTITNTGVWMSGDSKESSVIYCDANGLTACLLVNNPSTRVFSTLIEHILFESSTNVTVQPDGIAFRNASEFYVSHCRFGPRLNHGLVIDGVEVSRVDKSEFANVSYGVYLTHQAAGGFPYANVELTGSTFDHTTNAAVWFDNNTRKSQFHHNWIENTQNGFLFSNSTNQAEMDDVEIDSVIFQNVAGTGFNPGKFISVIAPANTNFLIMNNLMVRNSTSWTLTASNAIEFITAGNLDPNNTHFTASFIGNSFAGLSSSAVYADSTQLGARNSSDFPNTVNGGKPVGSGLGLWYDILNPLDGMARASNRVYIANALHLGGFNVTNENRINLQTYDFIAWRDLPTTNAFGSSSNIAGIHSDTNGSVTFYSKGADRWAVLPTGLLANGNQRLSASSGNVTIGDTNRDLYLESLSAFYLQANGLSLSNQTASIFNIDINGAVTIGSTLNGIAPSKLILTDGTGHPVGMANSVGVVANNGSVPFVATIGTGLQLVGATLSATGTNGGSTNAIWGNITGTLSNQTDLQNALNLKQNSLTTGVGVTNLSNVVSWNAAPGGNVTFTTNANGNVTIAALAVGATAGELLWNITSNTNGIGDSTVATTYAQLTANGTNVQVTLPVAGTYNITAMVGIFAPSSFQDNFRFTNTTSHVAIGSPFNMTSSGNGFNSALLGAFVTTGTANNVVNLWGSSGDATYGSHYLTGPIQIRYVRVN